jgi:hypothetical protein
MGIGGYRGEPCRELFVDVVWEAPDTLPTGGVIRGRDAVLEQ